MKLTLGILFWLLALVVGGVSYSNAKDYNLVATGYRSAAVLYQNVPTSYVCLGVATWAANNAAYTENWSVQHQNGTQAWKDAPTTNTPEQWNQLATTYQSPTPCDNLNGIVENHFGLYPTGLYGGYVFWSDGWSEWNHNFLERPVRSMPLRWKVSGELPESTPAVTREGGSVDDEGLETDHLIVRLTKELADYVKNTYGAPTGRAVGDEVDVGKEEDIKSLIFNALPVTVSRTSVGDQGDRADLIVLFADENNQVIITRPAGGRSETEIDPSNRLTIRIDELTVPVQWRSHIIDLYAEHEEKIREVYGPPLHSNEVTISVDNDLNPDYNGLYLIGSNMVLLSGRLLQEDVSSIEAGNTGELDHTILHELGHAWRDDYIFPTSEIEEAITAALEVLLFDGDSGRTPVLRYDIFNKFPWSFGLSRFYPHYRYTQTAATFVRFYLNDPEVFKRINRLGIGGNISGGYEVYNSVLETSQLIDNISAEQWVSARSSLAFIMSSSDRRKFVVTEENSTFFPVFFPGQVPIPKRDDIYLFEDGDVSFPMASIVSGTERLHLRVTDVTGQTVIDKECESGNRYQAMFSLSQCAVGLVAPNPPIINNEWYSVEIEDSTGEARVQYATAFTMLGEASGVFHEAVNSNLLVTGRPFVGEAFIDRIDLRNQQVARFTLQNGVVQETAAYESVEWDGRYKYNLVCSDGIPSTSNSVYKTSIHHGGILDFTFTPTDLSVDRTSSGRGRESNRISVFADHSIKAQLEVLNAAGQHVKDGGTIDGSSAINIWDGTNDQGDTVAAGTYTLRITGRDADCQTLNKDILFSW